MQDGLHRIGTLDKHITTAQIVTDSRHAENYCFRDNSPARPQVMQQGQHAAYLPHQHYIGQTPWFNFRRDELRAGRHSLSMFPGFLPAFPKDASRRSHRFRNRTGMCSLELTSFTSLGQRLHLAVRDLR